MTALYLKDDYVAGEVSTFLTNRFFVADGSHRGALYCHGAGGTGAEPLNATDISPKLAELLAAISQRFLIPVYAGDNGGLYTWGNSTSQTRVGQCKTRLQALGAKAGKVVIIGVSMGACIALNYARNNPGDVAAVVGILPVVDLDDIRNNDRASFRGYIDAAWGVTYPAALPAGANPATSYTAPPSFPIQLWYASDDPVCIPATVTALGATVGADLHNIGTGGHSDTSIGHVSVETMFQWLAANGAL